MSALRIRERHPKLLDESKKDNSRDMRWSGIVNTICYLKGSQTVAITVTYNPPVDNPSEREIAQAVFGQLSNKERRRLYYISGMWIQADVLGNNRERQDNLP